MKEFSHGYALIIGVANYQRVRRLPNTVLNDARDIRNLLCSPDYSGYPEAQVRLLLDDQATVEGCREGFTWLAQHAGVEDTVLIFFSGHGFRIESGPEARNYLLPYDVDIQHLSITALSGNEITRLLSTIRAQKLVVLFDCCHAGGIGDIKSLGMEGLNFKIGMAAKYYEQLAQGIGRVIIASSREDEFSLVMAGMQNSLFTHYLLKGLKGKVRTEGDGVVRVFELFDYVSQALTLHGDMHPIFKAHNLENNFAIALYQVGKSGPITQEPALPGPTAGGALHSRPTELRQMLLSAFNEDELVLFCRDYFQPVLGQFSNQMSLTMKTETLITYCERRGLVSQLLEKLQEERPNLFDRAAKV